MISFFSTISSCKKNSPAAPLTIDDSTTLRGAGGSNVIVNGTGFAAAGNDHISINGVNVTVVSATSTSLTFTVPARVGSGTLSLTVNGQTVNGPAFIYDTVWAVSTFAGSTQGSADGTGTAAQFNYPVGICMDGAGNLYVTEQKGNKVRMITAGGVVTTLAGGTQGSTDGQGTAASFHGPLGICADASGNLFVADAGNSSIRKITSSGLVSTLVSSTSNFPIGQTYGICVDGAGNLFYTDAIYQVVYKRDVNGVVSLLAGDHTPADKDGAGPAAEFAFPAGICLDAQGNLYVAELNKNIRKITTGQAVSTVSNIVNPYFLCADAKGRLFVTGFGGGSVSEVSAAGGVVTIAGGGSNGFADGIGNAAAFYGIGGICMDVSGNLYVADGVNNRIRKITWQ